jgi:hypothetical protein
MDVRAMEKDAEDAARAFFSQARDAKGQIDEVERPVSRRNVARERVRFSIFRAIVN